MRMCAAMWAEIVQVCNDCASSFLVIILCVSLYNSEDIIMKDNV